MYHMKKNRLSYTYIYFRLRRDEKINFKLSLKEGYTSFNQRVNR